MKVFVVFKVEQYSWDTPEFYDCRGIFSSLDKIPEWVEDHEDFFIREITLDDIKWGRLD